MRCDKQGRFKPLQRFHEKLECFFPNGADFINDYVGTYIASYDKNIQGKWVIKVAPSFGTKTP